MSIVKRKGPLAGLRVIELTNVMAGPVAGLLLADMGADVIKVEKLPGGDDTRRATPPEINGESAAFMMVNRNKRGIVVDLKNAAGVDLLKKMIKSSDVVIENFRPGTMEKLGLDFPALSALNPALIYCKITGFGLTGPYAQRAGYDLIAQGMSGLMSLTGEGEGRPPVKVGVPIGDVTAGILASSGILAAYIERLRTGQGQYLDTSLFEASMIHTYWQMAMAFATGESAGPMGSAHPVAAPYQAMPTQDGWLNVGAVSQATWQGLTRAVELPELLADARFTTNADRMRNRDQLIAIISEALAADTTANWVLRFERQGVPAGPVLNMQQVIDDPQTAAREMVINVKHPVAGEIQSLGLPIKFSGGNGVTDRGAPLYGEHTLELLKEFDVSPAEIDALIEANAVHALVGATEVA